MHLVPDPSPLSPSELRPRRRRRTGFSFVEILVAITLLALALPIFLFMRTGRKTVEGTRDISTATYLATQALETIQSWDYDTLCEEDLVGAPPPPPGASATSCEAVFKTPERSSIQIGSMVFRRTVDIQPLGRTDATDIKMVKVRVEWDRKNATLQYEVSTAVSRAR